MRRSSKAICSGALVLAVVATPGLAAGEGPRAATTSHSISTTSTATESGRSAIRQTRGGPTGADTNVDISAIISKMSLRQKVGQLFVLDFAGQNASTPDSTAAATNLKQYGLRKPTKIVRKYQPGGVIYFGSNVKSPRQTAQLSNGLQRAALAKSPKVPLAISTDQEGGSVTRFEAPATVSPGNMAVGATFNRGTARRIARVLGSEMAALGVRYNLAPVVDVNTNPFNTTDGTRSFGDRPKPVAKFSAATVRAQQRTGVAVTAKHFPGLGSTTTDTDLVPTTSNQTKKQFKKLDFPPFEAAIEAKTDSIMVSHLVAPALDSRRLPASLSKRMVTGLLRKDLGFDGVAITDALVAGALKQWNSRQLAVRAIRAGNDMLLMPPNIKQAIKGLISAVRSGRITHKRIDQSVERILEMKQNAGILTSPKAAKKKARKNIVGIPAHLKVAQSAADQGTTLISRSTTGAPLRAGSKVLLTGAGFGTALPSIGALMTQSGAVVDQVATGIDPKASDVQAAITAAPGHDAVVVLTYNAWGFAGQRDLIAGMLATGVPVILAFLATPYDAALAPNARANIAVYSDMPPARTALVTALFGREPTGKLPVTVHSLTDPNQVLFEYGQSLGWN